jgi:hypothetical protein
MRTHFPGPDDIGCNEGANRTHKACGELCSGLHAAPPYIWEIVSMDQARRSGDRGAKTAGKGSSHQGDSTPHAARMRPGAPAHLDALPMRKPARKSAQIRWLWPEISEALAAGHTIGDVRRELALDGIEISYSKLRTYVARLRKTAPRNPPHNSVSESRTPASNGPCIEASPRAHSSAPGPEGVKTPPYDPLANLRERLSGRPGFRYDDRPPDEKKLI